MTLRSSVFHHLIIIIIILIVILTITTISENQFKIEVKYFLNYLIKQIQIKQLEKKINIQHIQHKN